MIDVIGCSVMNVLGWSMFIVISTACCLHSAASHMDHHYLVSAHLFGFVICHFLVFCLQPASDSFLVAQISVGDGCCITLTALGFLATISKLLPVCSSQFRIQTCLLQHVALLSTITVGLNSNALVFLAVKFANIRLCQVS